MILSFRDITSSVFNLKKSFMPFLIKLMTRIQVICVLFISTILAEQSSMVAAIAQSIDIRVIFAINQEMILILCNETFDNVIRLDKYSLVSLNRVIVFAMTS
jgi:hypothetical protein